jgi:hypothetical protein
MWSSSREPWPNGDRKRRYPPLDVGGPGPGDLEHRRPSSARWCSWPAERTPEPLPSYRHWMYTHCIHQQGGSHDQRPHHRHRLRFTVGPRSLRQARSGAGLVGPPLLGPHGPVRHAGQRTTRGLQRLVCSMRQALRSARPVPEWAIEQGRDNARKANELAEQRERRIADKAAGVRPISSHTRSLWSTSPEGRLAERERRLARRVQDLGGPHDERTPEA